MANIADTSQTHDENIPLSVLDEGNVQEATYSNGYVSNTPLLSQAEDEHTSGLATKPRVARQTSNHRRGWLHKKGLLRSLRAIFATAGLILASVSKLGYFAGLVVGNAGYCYLSERLMVRLLINILDLPHITPVGHHIFYRLSLASARPIKFRIKNRGRGCGNNHGSSYPGCRGLDFGGRFQRS